ncbi:LANO_0E10132g1_1 [Lachancea nothofagi CBS 11611]|uniref:LANO_0E10132g1_1 n=1 Tax=Lachancea nothofagi CBS 11611 TaxID=1266666 RepID=A0A1G4JWP2_9SACH|nr:LANO_0E10132g1_1 [Lachancea nothofagi CBS 11611]
MSEDTVFFQQAAEAIVATSLKSSSVDPTIRELLTRLKYVDHNKSATRMPQQIPSENKSVLNYFDQLLNNVESTSSGTDEQMSSTVRYSGIKKRKTSETGDSVQKDDTKDNTSADDESAAKKFPCAKCELVFRRSSDLRRHERAHLPILPNICSLCGKGFARKDALKRHFDTMTCKRNREKLLSIGGDINEILEKARLNGANV